MRSPEGKDLDISAPLSARAEILQAIRSGKLTPQGLAEQVDQYLATGASASDLLTELRDGDAVRPLPPGAYEEVRRRISGRAAHTAVDMQRLDDAPTTVLGNEPDPAAAGDTALEGSSSIGPHSSVAVGDVLQARFRLVELVGEGGMSRVFKAIDLRRVEARSDNPYIAVKVLTLPFDVYFGSLAALQDEAQKLQRLAHPNIVRVFDCDRDGKTVFMTMEYLVGSRLRPSVRHTNQLDVADSHRPLAVITAVADALEYAHRNHIVHGDLKPGNVILTEDGEVKVIDFGISRWMARPDTELEEPLGARTRIAWAATERYASPQMMARESPQPPDDVYALACMAYEMLTGSHPFDGTRTETSTFPPPELPGLTGAQYAAIVKGLKFERADRTASIAQFMAEFGAAPPPALRKSRPSWPAWIAVAAAVIAGIWMYSRHEAAEGPAQSSSVQTTTPASSIPTPVPVTAAAPGSLIRDCATCPYMTVLPSGRFLQGSSIAVAASKFEQPQHWVTLQHPPAMAPHEVTVGEFRLFAEATRRNLQGCDTYEGEWHHEANASWQSPGFAQGATHPVTCTSWNDAVAYAAWLSAKTGHLYRLPSASEWEYASRAGSDAANPWHSDGSKACADANLADRTAAHRFEGWEVVGCSDGYVNTAPVGSFQANAFGLNDMLGNVFEWTEDCWHENYVGAPTDGSARRDGDCTEHELRGGSWFSAPTYVTSSYRDHFAADYRTSSVGFRLVREMSP